MLIWCANKRTTAHISMLKKLILVLLSTLILGCSSLKTVSNAPLEEGQKLTYSESYDFVKQAVIFAVENMDVQISNRRESEDDFVILFTNGMSAFSWGEVGRIRIVKEKPDLTTVYVHTEKRSTYQLMGPTSITFANEIYLKAREYIDFQKAD